MYDAIIVGARAAGSPTAMLLARKGHRVLVVDRASFPSDTLSTHYIHQPGVARLRRWGLLDRLIATGCPPSRSLVFNLGAFALTGAQPRKPAPKSAPASPSRSSSSTTASWSGYGAGPRSSEHASSSVPTAVTP